MFLKKAHSSYATNDAYGILKGFRKNYSCLRKLIYKGIIQLQYKILTSKRGKILLQFFILVVYSFFNSSFLTKLYVTSSPPVQKAQITGDLRIKELCSGSCCLANIILCCSKQICCYRGSMIIYLLCLGLVNVTVNCCIWNELMFQKAWKDDIMEFNFYRTCHSRDSLSR